MNLHMFLCTLQSMNQYNRDCNIRGKWTGNLTNKNQNIPNRTLQSQMR